MEQQDFMPVGPHSFTVAHTILEARAVPKWDTKSAACCYADYKSWYNDHTDDCLLQAHGK